MALYAISDLHLSFYKEKKMDKFGDNWQDHHLKLKNNWENIVSKEDTVLIPGDISWAMRLEEAMPDLEFIESLPGQKIIHSGNHDFWWSSTSRLNELFDSIYFLKNSYREYKGKAICGTRGWTCPNDSRFTKHDEKIYKRELARMELSLNMARQAGYEDIILSVHYPPTNDKKETSGFTDIIEKHQIKTVIYGHLHGQASFDASFKGNINGTEYYLVSGDYLDFSPIKIMD